MKQEIKDEWVTELRSGDYEQSRMRLRRRNDQGTDEFCCLGVLCEIAVKHQVIAPAVLNEFGNDYTYFDGDERHSAYLPDSVVAWAELPNTDPKVQLPTGGRESLVHMNDEGQSFDRIADVVENLL